MLAKAVMFCTVYTCMAHVCMLSPPQRTALINLNKPGSGSCILVKPPCGETKPVANKLSLVGGSNFTVVFQKNLDHFNKANPGYWSVSISKDGMHFKELYHTADTAVPSLTLYTANITIPDVQETVPMVIQTRYVTNNPNAPAVFYQCSDIFVRKGN